MSSDFRKPLLLAAGVFCAAAYIFSFTVDLWVERRLAFIESALSEALQRPIEIRHAGYSIIEGFIFDELTVKEIKTVPIPFTVRRVRAMPDFQFFPAPKITIHRLVFEGPRLGLVGKPEELFRGSTLLRRIPDYKTMIGRVALEMRLTSFRIEDGRIVVFADHAGKQVRQEFEKVSFFSGERWMRKNRMRLWGRIAGKPEARFRIDSDLLKEAPGSYDTNIRVDLHEFTSSYLAPYLKDRFNLPEKNLTASLKLKIRDGRRIESEGQFDLPSIGFDDRLLRYLTRRTPRVRYYVMGYWRGNGIEFSKINLKGRYARLSGKGRIDFAEGKESYRLSLVSPDIPLERYRDLPKPWKLESGIARLSVNAAGSAKEFHPVIEAHITNASMVHEASAVRLSKIEGKLLITPTSIGAEELWMFAGNMPLRVSGEIRNGLKGRSFDLDVSNYPGQIDELKAKNPLNAALFVRAEERGGFWRGYSDIRLDDYSSGHGAGTKGRFAFKGLNIVERSCERLVLRSLMKDGKESMQPLSMSGIEFMLHSGRERMRADIVHARLAGGTARGSLRFDLKDSSWKARFDLDGIRYRELASAFRADHPVDGRLKARGNASGGSKRPNVLELVFSLKDGTLGPSPELAKYAAQTGIDPLGSMRFEDFSGHVLFRKGLWTLDRLKLAGRDVRLSARLLVRDGIVNGRLSVRFAVSAIRPSSQLAWLLGFVGQKDWVDFDFHVAGTLDEPRIEWMAGEFRKKIESLVPSFLRGELARHIERRLTVVAA